MPEAFDPSSPPDLNSPHVVFSMVNLMQHACHGLTNAPTALGHFIRVSLTADPACVADESPRDLWPIPPQGGVGWEVNA